MLVKDFTGVAKGQVYIIKKIDLNPDTETEQFVYGPHFTLLAAGDAKEVAANESLADLEIAKITHSEWDSWAAINAIDIDLTGKVGAIPGFFVIVN